MITYSSAELAKLFGTTTRTIERWSAAGALRPSGESRYRFGIIDIVACALCRDLAKRGFSEDACAQVAGWVRSHSLDELQAQWELGQQYMLLIGDQPPFFRLFEFGEIFDNPGVDLAGALKLGIQLAVVDVLRAFSDLTAKLDASSEAEAVEGTR